MLDHVFSGSHSPIQNGFLPANLHSQLMSLLERTLVRLLLNLTQIYGQSQTHIWLPVLCYVLCLNSYFYWTNVKMLFLSKESGGFKQSVSVGSFQRCWTLNNNLSLSVTVAAIDPVFILYVIPPEH